MYDEHFGLAGRPFQLTPDPRFWFETATHHKAMAYLGYGLAQGEGFIVVTGDIGAGKTTLMGHLIDTIDHDRLQVIQIVSTAIEADDLLRIVATGLGIDPAGLSKAQLLTVIERGLHAVARTGRRTLLVVDEAQALPVSALEELRMLSNFQAGGHALLQIVLLGQPEFRDRLHGAEGLEQLRQRIIAIHHLDPMEGHEVADYLAHRLSVVGWQGRPDFAADAFDAFHQGSGGVPRRLNLLAGRVMLHAAIEDAGLIDGAMVRHVLADLHSDLPVAGAVIAEAVLPDDRHPTGAVDEPVVSPPVPSGTERPTPETAREPASIDATVQPFTDIDTIAEANESEPVEEAPVIAPTAPTVVEEPASAAAPVVEAVAPNDVEARIVALETRVAEQEAALQRALALMVDWVEQAPAREVAPLRGLARWDDAA